MADKLQRGKFDSFTTVNNGLIETELLTVHEKIVYIVIRKHLNQESQVAFPGMATIARQARISKSQVLRAIKGLEEKKLLMVERQTTDYNEKKTNIYRFNDFPELWKAKTVDELKKIATETPMPLTDDEIIDKALQIDKKKRQKLYNQLAKEFEKEKASESLPAHQSDNDSNTQSNNININKNTMEEKKNQDKEKYTIDQIKQFFDYGIMLQEHPDLRQHIDTVMNALHTAMNSGKPEIRIAGQDKPAMTVIGKLMKLDKESILYAIKKYSERTEKVKNPAAYMLTILYNAPEQRYLDMKNQESRDNTKSGLSKAQEKTYCRNKDSKNNYTNFQQREYDYVELERILLTR